MIQSRNRQLLYVDDTEEQRYAMRRILENAGFQVREASTGAQALAMLHQDIRVVILDVKLPDISGYEVCRRIKADPATCAMPVLQVSASFADPLLRAAGLSGGADAYVAQPVHPAELLALVNALIRSHEAERTLRFQAEVSSRLGQSLDYAKTLRCLEQVFSPRFTDAAYTVLRRPAPAISEGLHGESEAADTPGLSPELARVAQETIQSGTSRLLEGGKAIIVPMDVGPRRLGALVFTLQGEDRQYTRENLALAKDLADRGALALQNASLFTAQQSAQHALIQSEKLAAAGRLSAAIAHEINNPLEAITNLMYLIQTSPEITPSLKTYATEALSELGRLTHIARQTLGFYRELSASTVFDLNESVEDTINIYGKRLEAKRIELCRNFASGPLLVPGVKGEIRQVFSNLLVNAYDALPSGGRLMVETGLEPNEKDANSPGCAVLRVRDNGPGIPPEVLGRIFEPFFTTKAGTGTGLGLWVSESIVHKHGGTLEVDTRRGDDDHGTTFEVRLPGSPKQ